MQKNVFRFIYKFSRRDQFLILFFTILSFPFMYYSLELPKLIVNEAIGGAVDFPVEVLGLTLDQITYLFVLSGIFLALVCINGAFKYYLNVYRGVVGERMLRRLRYDLYHRVLRFPLPRFKRMSQGEIIPMITAEVEPIGGFVGDAFALPAYQGGTLLVYLVFIFMQDPFLGAAAISLYPLQGYLIPKLQKRVNQLGKQRVRTVRQLSDKIGETVGGVQEIHANDTANLHLADAADRLGTIYDIRFEIYKRKFFIKFLNNFLNQLTPFFFYSIGGYLVITGGLSLGALVAVLAAYKDLSGPWRELLNYYQRVEDTRIKYEQVVEQFDPPNMTPESRLAEDPPFEGPLPDTLNLINVGYGEDHGISMLDGITVPIRTHGHTAVIGPTGSGKDELLMLVGRLVQPTSGRIRLGDYDYTDLPEALTGRRIAYVGPSSYLFTDSLRTNLYYGLRHRPLRPAEYDPDTEARRRRRLSEAMATGNTGHDVLADWIDYEAAGVAGPDELQDRALEILRMVEMEADVYFMGLKTTLTPERHDEVVDKVLEARRVVRERLQDPALGDPVELFAADRFNDSATVAENLLFGTPVGDTFALDGLATQPYVLHVLDKVGLTGDFLDMGRQVAATMIELFADLPPGHEFFDQFSFIGSDELPEFQPLVARANKEGFDSLKAEDRARLMSLPFKLIPSRHRLGLIDDAMKDRLLEARRVFAADLPEDLRGAVEFFDVERYNTASSLQDNILFGKIRYGRSGVQDRVQALIAEVVDDLGFRDLVIALGLDQSVGVGGARLSAVQRQKLALARALLRRPELIILNEATSALDAAAQQRVHDKVINMFQDRGLIWAPHRPGLVSGYDEVIVLKNGRLAGRGSFSDLSRDGGPLHDMLAAE